MSAEAGCGPRPAAALSRFSSLAGRNRLQQSSSSSTRSRARVSRSSASAASVTTTMWQSVPMARKVRSAATATGQLLFVCEAGLGFAAGAGAALATGLATGFATLDGLLAVGTLTEGAAPADAADCCAALSCLATLTSLAR